MADVLNLRLIKNKRKLKEDHLKMRHQKADALRISKSLKEAVPEVPTTIDGFCLLYFRHSKDGDTPNWGIAYDFRDFRDYVAFPSIFHHVWHDIQTSGGS